MRDGDAFCAAARLLGEDAMTWTRQILSRAVGRDVRPGDEVWARVDLAVMHDSSGPRRIAPILERMGNKLWDRDKVVVASDHFTPAANIRHAEILQKTRTWAGEFGIQHFYDEQGILHNILMEEGLVAPGMLVVGADSHICTVGAFGAVSIGVGSTELAMVLASGEIWLTVPEAVLVRLDGRLRPGLAARDVTLHLLGSLGADFALDRAVEFGGDGLRTMGIDERAVLTNQAVEMGAVSALMAPDEHVWSRVAQGARRGSGCGGAGADPQGTGVNRPVPDRPGTGASGSAGELFSLVSETAYSAVFPVDLADIRPLVARPPRVDAVQAAEELASVKLDKAYLGSCAGGKYEDLQAAASVVRRRKVKIPFTVVPATREVYMRALESGIIRDLVEAGATVQAAGCGACAGLHSGLLAPGERCIATVTRNFPGRMGDRSAEVYLASPFTVAASALTGRISDPREFVGEGDAA